jgi:cytochrome c-type biogenesis protein CcmH/NrfG
MTMSEQENSSNDAAASESPIGGWQGHHVYLMALACLVLGVALGYFLRGSQSPVPATATLSAPQAVAPGHNGMEGQRPSLERMKMMADKAAAPALEKLKQNPNDFETLNELGKLYRGTHQFKEAMGYYERALAVDPKNAAARTDLASCLYYTGDIDGALAQLDKALSYDPKFFGALLNTGIIKLRAKNDVPGAVASWEKILKTDADPKQKQMVKKLIADAKHRTENANGEDPKG